MLLCPKSTMLSIYIQIFTSCFFRWIPTLNVHLPKVSSIYESWGQFPANPKCLFLLNRARHLDISRAYCWQNLANQLRWFKHCRSDTVSLHVNQHFSAGFCPWVSKIEKRFARVHMQDMVTWQDFTAKQWILLAFGQGIVIQKSWSSWFCMMYTYDTISHWYVDVRA